MKDESTNEADLVSSRWASLGKLHLLKKGENTFGNIEKINSLADKAI